MDAKSGKYRTNSSVNAPDGGRKGLDARRNMGAATSLPYDARACLLAPAISAPRQLSPGGVGDHDHAAPPFINARR